VLLLVALQAVLVLLGLGVTHLAAAWSVVATVGSAVLLAALVGIRGFVTVPDTSEAS
jgi:hypothetical protein